ncbi:MAG TPA: efflux RND transporter periplasmic adaptor subunit [Chthoniobacterales bacterium]|jgi:RND family efflux transporter MFP subunit|nr:efflux RND transporter periplasmic adaptor subunit [Chthoniobacterales bacterium]
MSEGNLAVAEVQEREAAPQIVKERKLRVPFLAGAIVLVALAALGIESWFSRTQPIQERSNKDAEMTVTVVHPQKASITIPVLPGQTQAYTDAPIFAQTSGYLRKWYFDIGGKVKAGDVLAEIDTPEVDQELAQAQAQLKVAQSALNLAEVTYRRSQDLFKRLVIAGEDFDTAADTYRENQATVLADQAIINRLEALEEFKIIRAPFNGIVTARNTDLGDYIAAGSGTQLFRMQQTSPLRVYVNVPQDFADLVKIGTEGDLTLEEFPGRKFVGHVTNTAKAIDPTSRTLLTELQVPNETGELFPGAYALIALQASDNTGILTIPSNALLFRMEGTAVGVVDANGQVEIRKVTTNLNLGDKLEISQGLSETDQVIVNPSDSLATGMTVEILKQKQTSKE